MVERQDIDALLISALYGELTPADEARLTAHLESHPTDRTALEDLRGTREKLQQSRILAFQYEPPQSVSALLMQEASRRAPKRAPEGEGWFARFVRSFIQHPAMAAAAMLVVVVGASALVSRTGNKFADTPAVETATTDESGAIAMESPPAGAPSPSAAPAAAPTAGADQFKVDLVGGELEAASADKNSERDGKAEAKASPETDPNVGFYNSNNKGGDKLAKPDTGLELRRRDPGPKDLDDTTTRSVAPSEQKPKKTSEGAKVAVDSPPADEVSLDRGFADGRSSTVGGASRGGGGAPGMAAPVAPTTPTTTTQQGPSPRANAPRTPPPPPPAPVRQEIATDASREAQSRDQQEKQKSADKATNDPNLAWAKDQHSALVSAVRANNCGRAANIALAIANRAPGYYAQNVETDRSVKECIAYINNEREKDAELRASRAKKSQLKAAEPAAPKRAADQPARATESK